MGKLRRLKAREVVMLALLTALTVLGNEISLSFLPIQAGTGMVLLSGVSFGPFAGFVVGAFGRLICNFFQGQGIWTIYQMFTWGLLGVIAGLLFYGKTPAYNKKSKSITAFDIKLTVFTFLVVFIVYGGIMNAATLLMSITGVEEISFSALKATYASGIPYDLWHATRASIFVFLFGNMILQKFERVKIKYGFYRIRK